MKRFSFVRAQFPFRILSFFVLTFWFFQSDANPDHICEDLYKLTCAPGTYNDGTGVAENPMSLKASQVEIGLRKQAKIASGQFKKELEKPDNSYFRKIVLSGTGLSLNPMCKGAEDTPTPECLELMVEGLTDLAVRKANGSAPLHATAQSVKDLPDIMFIIDSPVFNKISADMVTRFKSEMKTDELETKVRDKVFPQVRRLLIESVAKNVSDPELRKKLVGKIKSIRYEGSNCSEDMTGVESISGLMIPNAFYHPTKNIFKYCIGMGALNQSEFQLAYVIAHELTHSIDPCCIGVGPKEYTFQYKKDASLEQAQGQHPFGGVLACLRTKESVGARNFLVESTASYYPGLAATSGMLGQSPKFEDFCNQDQIGEAFSDWMASEITPEYIESMHPSLNKDQMRIGYSNIFRGGCSPGSDVENTHVSFMPDVHPESKARINNVILMQPKIRAQMGCSKTVEGRKYCSHPVGDGGFSPQPAVLPETRKPSPEGSVQ